MSQTRLVPPHGLRVKTKMAAHCFRQFKFLLRYHIMVCLMCFLFYREYCVVQLQAYPAFHFISFVVLYFSCRPVLLSSDPNIKHFNNFLVQHWFIGSWQLHCPTMSFPFCRISVCYQRVLVCCFRGWSLCRVPHTCQWLTVCRTNGRAA